MQKRKHRSPETSQASNSSREVKMEKVVVGENEYAHRCQTVLSTYQPRPVCRHTQFVCMDQEEEEPAEEIQCKSDTPRGESEEEQEGVREGEVIKVMLGDPNALNCPICSKLLRPPVYQCDNGHLACHACCNLIGYKCRRCSRPIGSIRNRAIESVVKSAKTFCKHFLHGCTEEISYVNLHNHEETCKYGLCTCPVPDCGYVALPKRVYKHFVDVHAVYSELICFNSVISVTMCHGAEQYYFHEREEGILFVLHRVIHEPLGSFVKVTAVAPISSKLQFSYELTARSGDRSISLKTLVELTPELIVRPPEKNCLVVESDFYDTSCAYDPDRLILELVIWKLT